MRADDPPVLATAGGAKAKARAQRAAVMLLLLALSAVAALIVLFVVLKRDPAEDPVIKQPWVRNEHKPHRMAYQARFSTTIAHGNQLQPPSVRRVNVDILYRPTPMLPCAGYKKYLALCDHTYKLSVFLKNITVEKEDGPQEVFYSSKDQAFPPWEATLTANNTIVSLKGDANVSEAMKKDIKETVRLAFPQLAKRNYNKVDASGRRSSAPGFADDNTTQMPAPQGGRINASSLAVQGNGTTTLRVAIEDKHVINKTLPLAQSVLEESTFDEANGTLAAVNYTSTHVVGDESGVQLDVNVSSMLENFTVTQSSTLLSVEPEADDEGAHNASVVNEEELQMDPAEERFESDMVYEMEMPEDNSTAASANASREAPLSASRKLHCRPPVPTSLSSSSVTGDMTSGLAWSGKTTLARTRVLSTNVAADATLTFKGMVPKFHPNFQNQLRKELGGMADPRVLNGPNDGKLCAGANGKPCQVKCEFDQNANQTQFRQHCAQDLEASPGEKVCVTYVILVRALCCLLSVLIVKQVRALSVNVSVCVPLVHTHTHTHTHIQVYAPFTCEVIRANKWGHGRYSIRLKASKGSDFSGKSMKILYVKPTDTIVAGARVCAGQLLGTVQDISQWYSTYVYTHTTHTHTHTHTGIYDI